MAEHSGHGGAGAAAEAAAGAATSELDKDELLKIKDAFFGHGIVGDPFPRLAEMRAKCPVHQGSLPDYFDMVGPENILFGDTPQVTVFTYDGIERVFKDHESFSAKWYQPSLGPTIGRTILEMDPPEHGRYRRLIQGALTRKEMERWEREFVREIVDSFIDTFIDKGRADLVSEFAIQYPLRVLVSACALPDSDVDTFYRWAALLTNVGISEDLRLRTADEFGAYLQAAVDDRRDHPGGGDLVSLLVNARFTEAEAEAQGGKDRLTDEEIVSFLRLLLPAGAQTTYRTLCNLMVGLFNHPDQLAAVQADHSLIPQAIEEGLRWQPPLLSFGRVATCPAVIEGTEIEAGTIINLPVGVADRDPGRWEDPDEFDIFRPARPNLAFGSGNHVCLGIHFARMELRVALEQLLARLPDLRLDPDAGDVAVTGLGARSPDVVPVVFGPASGADGA